MPCLLRLAAMCVPVARSCSVSTTRKSLGRHVRPWRHHRKKYIAMSICQSSCRLPAHRWSWLCVQCCVRRATVIHCVPQARQLHSTCGGWVICDEKEEAMDGMVEAVHRRASHPLTKPEQPSIRLLAGLGVEDDAHMGMTVKHRSRVARDPSQPNLRQVHLIHAELHDELRGCGFSVRAGEMGEN